MSKTEMYDSKVPPPLREGSFRNVRERLLRGYSWSKKEVENFEGALAQNNSSQMEVHAMICLKDFCELMRKIDSEILHPVDLDKIFKDEEFKESFFTVVVSIRRYDFIGILKAQNKEIYKKIIESAEGYLIKAELYCAGE